MRMVAPVSVRRERAHALGLESGPETAHEPLRASVEEQANRERHDTSLPETTPSSITERFPGISTIPPSASPNSHTVGA